MEPKALKTLSGGFTMVSEREIEEILRYPHETEWIEIKHNLAIPEEIGQHISALSNSAALYDEEMAYLIWGADDQTHESLGTTFDFRQDVNHEPLEHFLARQLSPSVAFRFDNVTLKGRNLVVLSIPRATKVPTAFAKERYTRIGSSKELLSKYPEREAELWKVLREGAPTMINTPSEYQNLTFKKLFAYYAYKGHDLSEKNFKDNLHLLTEDGRYNLLAKVLSDNGSVSIKAGIFRGLSKADTLFSVKEFGDTCLLYSADAILSYGDVMNVMQADEIHRVAGRKETPLFDSDAYREAVLNALIHNKWVLGDAPMFEFFSDRIEIRSFGPLPPSQTEEGFYRGVSKPVNKELSEVFSLLGISDRLGRGVPKIVKAYGKSVVKFNSDSIVVTIPFLGASLALPAENATSKKELNETQKKILKAIEDNRNITTLELMIATSLSRPTVLRTVHFLKKEKRIRRKGSDKNGYWEIAARP